MVVFRVPVSPGRGKLAHKKYKISRENVFARCPVVFPDPETFFCGMCVAEKALNSPEFGLSPAGISYPIDARIYPLGCGTAR
jgi:hypothetical protein